MKKIIFCLFCASLLLADINNNVQQSTNEQDSKRSSNQIQEQKSKTMNKTLGQGSEKSYSNTTTDTLSKIESQNFTATKSVNGSLSLAINPVPIIIKTFRELGWDKRSFFLTMDDIGVVDYVVASDDDYGELQNLGKLEGIRNEAARQKRISPKSIHNLRQHISLLYNTGLLMRNAVLLLQRTPDLSVDDFENKVKQAASTAYNQTNQTVLEINQCNYGGDMNSYVCEGGKYTLILTNSVPTLLVDGSSWYSAQSVGHIQNASLNLSFANSMQDAFSKLTQNQASKSVAGMVRDYTNKLTQEGQSEVANAIKSKFVEKSLTTGTNKTASATVNAINSGSPTAVLKVFQ